MKAVVPVLALAFLGDCKTNMIAYIWVAFLKEAKASTATVVILRLMYIGEVC
jgi:hypothetical protein